MKKRVIVAMTIFMVVAASASAQVEVKINPIGLLFGSISGSVEGLLGERGIIGVEAMAGYKFPMENSLFAENVGKSTGFEASGLVKLYFNPDLGGDGYYFFPYVQYVNYNVDFNEDPYGDVEINYNAFGAGIGGGWKFVGEEGLLIDIGAGIGRNFTENYDIDNSEYEDEEDGEIFLPFNFLARVSIGYRF